MTRNAAIAPSELAMDESVAWVIMGLLVDSATGFQMKKTNTHLGGSKLLDKGVTLDFARIALFAFRGTVGCCNPSVICLDFII
jgi:hypothetical protein